MRDFNHIINNKTFSLNLSGLLDSLKIISKAEFETLSIVFEEDQFNMLLESLKEAQEGKIVSLNEAFSDLT